ncbi:hypothetical protein [Paradevosia shaoguanensis]|uniref:hypothetical protein n=1 Tax=Paradevosia shaoguanensis TaxID=1335043 RepID=UPI0019325765|nr:hypothetical protein [Paradevosia shaoguanensis]
MRDPKLPFPFPDLRDPFAPLPKTMPMTSRLSEMSGFWISATCACGKQSATLPARLMAATYGWDVTLGEFVSRLKCETCGHGPVLVEVMSDSRRTTDGRGHARETTIYIVLDRRGEPE